MLVLNGNLAERTLSMPAMFAPAHELTRQIHIVNAYCREAEYLRDPMQDSLWDVLDELIEVHAQIAPRYDMVICSTLSGISIFRQPIYLASI